MTRPCDDLFDNFCNITRVHAAQVRGTTLVVESDTAAEERARDMIFGALMDMSHDARCRIIRKVVDTLGLKGVEQP